MPFSDFTPTPGGTTTSDPVDFSVRVTGYTPTKVRLLLGSGRVARDATYNAGDGKWHVSFDPGVSPNGSIGDVIGQPPHPYFNYWCAVEWEASGGSHFERTTPDDGGTHWVFIASLDPTHTPAAFVAYRSAINWSPNFTANISSLTSAYGSAFVGEYMATMRADEAVPGRYYIAMRPDLAYVAPGNDGGNFGGFATSERDQPTTGGIRVNASAPPTIVDGDIFCFGGSYRFPATNPLVTSEEQHVNIFQYFGRDSNGPSIYNMGTMLALNLSARTHSDNRKILKDRDVVFSTGNKTNPGLYRPPIYRSIRDAKDKWIDFGFQMRVSSGPNGWIKWYMNTGESDSLQPVRQAIPHPDGNWYKTPFVGITPFHEPQRTDFQAYGERVSSDGPELWPNIEIHHTGHKQGSTIAAVDPLSYASVSRRHHRVVARGIALPNGGVARTT